MKNKTAYKVIENISSRSIELAVEGYLTKEGLEKILLSLRVEASMQCDAYTEATRHQEWLKKLYQIN